MNVRMVMNGSVITADVGESLREAATRMRSDGVSALPVMNGGELVGIVTERDIVTAVVHGLDLRTASVAGCMTADPASASPEDPVSDVAFQMVMLGARHVPVVEDGRLVGMLSARDLLGLVIPGVDTDGAGGPSGPAHRRGAAGPRRSRPQLGPSDAGTRFRY